MSNRSCDNHMSAKCGFARMCNYIVQSLICAVWWAFTTTVYTCVLAVHVCKSLHVRCVLHVCVHSRYRLHPFFPPPPPPPPLSLSLLPSLFLLSSSPSLSLLSSFPSSPHTQSTEMLDSTVITTIEQLSSESQIDTLSVRQLKVILQKNCIDYRGCVEKTELMERVHRLYQDRVDQKGECPWKSGHPVCERGVLIFRVVKSREYTKAIKHRTFLFLFAEVEARLIANGDTGTMLLYTCTCTCMCVAVFMCVCVCV